MKAGRIAVISARGGSKGIPRKNIIDIAGKPLIAYSIEAGVEAMKRGAIDKVIVSTDDEEIAEVSRKYGAEVPFMRPDYLASDSAKSVDLLIHAAEFYREQGIFYKDMLLLQPTTPRRTAEDIMNAFDIFDKEQADSLISCYKEDYICDLVTYYKDGNGAIPVNPNHNAGVRRQEVKDLYVRNGAIYISNIDYMIREHKIFGGKLAMYVMPKEKSVNIDTWYDVELARYLMGKNM